MKKNRNILKFILSLLGCTVVMSHASFALSETGCTDKEFSRPLGPNRSQKDIGWCYANASADLLTYRFQDELLGRRASAGYIALAFNDSIFNNFLKSQSEGGFAFLSLMLSQSPEYGICPASREEALLSQGPSGSLKQRLQDLLSLKKNFDQTAGRSLENDLQNLRAQGRHSFLTRMPNADLVDLLQRSRSPNNFSRLFADYVCGKEKVFPRSQAHVHMDAKYFTLGSTKRLIEKIHAQLDQNNIIAIGYFADFFDRDDAKNSNAGRHVSVIVGRKWNPTSQQCELRIRNSWGANCSSYKAESLNKPGVCVDGNIWVAESVLRKRVYGITYLDQ